MGSKGRPSFCQKVLKELALLRGGPSWVYSYDGNDVINWFMTVFYV